MREVEPAVRMGEVNVRAFAGILTLAILPLLVEPPATEPGPTLDGSPESMIRQNFVARVNRLAFARTPVDVARMVQDGTLVPVPGNADYRLDGVELPFAHPATRAFIEWTAREYYRFCGEPLVVTSLVRPLDQQPPNAHPLSVHPAGMAVDLRIPKSPDCERYLEEMLLSLETRGVIDVTRERRPPHLHVAVYPRAYVTYAALRDRDSAAADARRSAGRPARRAVPRAVWWLFGGLLAMLGGVVAWRWRLSARSRHGDDGP